MKYIQIPFQEAFDYFINSIVPYKFQDDDRDEILEWFDSWLDWLVGVRAAEGNDIAYLYAYYPPSEGVLKSFGIDFHIVDENGDEIRA